MVMMSVSLDVLETQRGGQAQVGLYGDDTDGAEIFAGQRELLKASTIIVQPCQSGVQHTPDRSFAILAADAAIAKLNRLRIRVQGPIGLVDDDRLRPGECSECADAVR